MRESFGIRIECEPVARVWGGVGDLIVPADIVESEPALYLGAGELINAPDFESNINYTAERIDIQLSGASEEMLRLALDEAASVRNARVHFVVFSFDDDWQLDEVTYEAVFRADKLSVSSEDGADGRSRNITLSIASEETNRVRAPMAYWTDQDQRRKSPTDAIFSFVSGIRQGVQRTFGPT